MKSGVSYMLVGVVLFVLNDTLGKWLAENCTLPQILALRSVAALAILVPIAWRTQFREFRYLKNWRGHAIRCVMVVGELACFYASIRGLPLVDVMTIYQATPLFVTAMSLPFLGERVSPVGWAAVAVGFVGVVLVLQPTGAAIQPEALYALLGSFLYALMLLMTRKLRTAGPQALLMLPLACITTVGTVLLPWAWVPLSGFTYVLLALIGVVALGAHHLVNRSLMLSPAAVVVPLQYTSILWACIAGWLVWGDVPGPMVIVGGVLIVGSGLFIMAHDRRRMRLATTVEIP